MKLSAKTDLDAPVGFTHACLGDPAIWEREAIRRGIEIERPADMPLAGPGAGWRIQVPFRGRVRKVLVRVEDLRPDDLVVYSFEGEALVGKILLETSALSPRRSRLRFVVDAKPKTLTARLFLNSLRLARGKVEARLEKRVNQLADQIEERFAREKL
jgi:hypothetical protein